MTIPVSGGPRRPEFDAALKPTLDIIGDLIPLVGLQAGQIPELRAAFAQRSSDEELALDGRYVIDDVVVDPVGANPPISLVVCAPTVLTSSVPVIYYLHGGGLVAGHNRSNLADIINLAAPLGAAVVSVEYRLAPEYPYPAALDDCLRGLDWIRSEGARRGFDVDRVVIAGTSAGGGLAAALALLDRDRAGSRRIEGLLLMSPMLDDRATPSAYQMEGVGIWDRGANATGWKAYLPDGPSEDGAGYDVPARASSFEGLAPTFLDVGSAETFRDEVVDLAHALWRAGGSAELHVWPGACHNFDSLVPGAALSLDTKRARAEWLGRLLALSRIVS